MMIEKQDYNLTKTQKFWLGLKEVLWLALPGFGIIGWAVYVCHNKKVDIYNMAARNAAKRIKKEHKGVN